MVLHKAVPAMFFVTLSTGVVASLEPATLNKIESEATGAVASQAILGALAAIFGFGASAISYVGKQTRPRVLVDEISQ